MMEAVRTSETSVDNHFTRQYIPEDNAEHHVLLGSVHCLNLKYKINPFRNPYPVLVLR
jgi:hypothetical protein